MRNRQRLSNPPFERFSGVTHSPTRLGVYILLSTAFATVLGMLPGGIILPLLQTLMIFPLFIRLVYSGRWTRTVVAMSCWALWMAVLIILLAAALGPVLEHRILLGADYREEMFSWIRTGIGRESDIGRFLPQHMIHFLSFSLFTAVSAGFLGLLMGSVLMNYMSFYVGSLLGLTDSPFPLLLIAWPPWAALRVVGFITVATALAGLSLDRLGLGSHPLPKVRRFLFVGLTLLVTDILLKWWLAAVWQEWLAELVTL